MLHQAIDVSDAIALCRSPEQLFRDFGRECGFSSQELDTFPDIGEIQTVYAQVAEELSGSHSPYLRNRSADLKRIAGALALGGPDILPFYEAALMMLRTHRFIGTDRAFMPRVDATRLIDPSANGLGPTNLGNDAPDIDLDCKIAARLYAKLPERCKIPFRYPFDP